MIMEFKTAVNKNGNSKYLAFDTESETYSTQSRTMITVGHKVSSKVYRDIIEQLKVQEYKKVDYVC